MRLLVAWLAVAVSGDNMMWTDESTGAVFDWSALGQSEDFVLLSPTSDDILTTEYTFAFGHNLVDLCSGEPVSVVERDIVYGQVFQDCSVLGRHEMRQVQLLNPDDPRQGIQLTYSGGHICSSVERMIFNQPRKTIFRLVCGPEGEFSFVENNLFDLSECEVMFERVTKAACPLKFVPTVWSKTRKIWLL